ncbi:trigger factor [Halotalea alkalilenta]|uniref:Trigger factor n=1 Tax=Halotalea alkalilenta TaxID=376489 RepID=A0A172YEL5_9GAMM|nr:trigger factor [Halotalea alkalilenta]ANF57710.1 trigger factor [Halotalea alkalilenta]
MQVSVETTSAIGRRLTIQVPAAQVDQAVDARLQQTARNVKLKGFRPGKVPMKVVRSRFGSEARSEAVGELIRQNYVQALTQESLNPAGFPEIEPTVNEPGKDLEFVASIEVYPQIELVGIEGAEIERPKAEITDADVDEMVETLRKQAADWSVVERAAEDGDQVTIDFEGFIGDEAFEGGKGEGHKLVLGSASFIPGFEGQLVGASAGDEPTLSVTFPADYQAEHLAGKEATFKTKVHKVEAQSLPEIDAEFTKRFGVESGDLAEFKAEVRKNMQRELDSAVENRVKQQVIDALKSANPIEVPKALVQQEIDALKRQAAQQFGLGDDFDVTQLPNELFEEQGRSRVQVGLLLAEVISQQGVEASDEEIRAFAERVAQQYQQPEQVVEQYLANEQMKNQLKSAVLENKSVEKLLEQAKVSEVEMSYQDALAAAQAKEEDEQDADADAEEKQTQA